MMIQESISSHPELDSGSITISKLTSYLTNPEFLTQIYGIGDKMILALQAFFHDTTNIQILQSLVNDGVNISPDKQTTQTAFTGIHFCITGSFEASRDTIIAACEAQGMIFDPSPTSKTKYLLVGDK
jgi:NAD-dependent DNA ligase